MRLSLETLEELGIPSDLLGQVQQVVEQVWLRVIEISSAWVCCRGCNPPARMWLRENLEKAEVDLGHELTERLVDAAFPEPCYTDEYY